ncbi:uncharacterized protein LOC143043544 [Mytilus galloprovincialis]|uniref:uncharacterized protein LOC143043544 n=1 Tax=Mytilus galloprovincialis TaxID=29158 RepID=UPI003F7BF421
MFVTSNIAATGTVCRIRHSKSMKIKIYSKDESLIDEEMAGDLSGLKTLIKKYTVVERNPQEMVDVFLPVPILKGNVIIVDTPGIGENNELCDILMDFLPHAVSFVFIINAKNAGGIHEDRLLRILKTVIEKQKEMPCFEPEDVIFLTNQWDIIDNIKEDGDEEDEHTKTWNKIQYKLAEGWPCFHADRIFKISLKQVGEGLNTHTTREFKTFKTMLDATIEKNKNKRVEYYFRFIQKFAINAEMGIMSRIHLLEISDDDRTKQILKTKETIQKLKTVAQEKLKEAKEYKTEVIKKLAEQLLSYLHSDNVQNDILNPPSRKRINLEPIVSFRKEVLTRINMGISKWCAGEDVILVIQEIESKIKTLLSEVESIIRIIDEDLAGFSRSIHDVSFNVFKQSALRMTLISNGSCIIELVKLVLNRPSLDNRQLMKEKQAHNMYKACLSTLTFDHIRSCFEDNFGTEYDSVISRFEFEILQNTIGLYTTINKNLFELSDNKKKTQSFTVLHGLVNEIKTKIDEFKAGAQL